MDAGGLAQLSAPSGLASRRGGQPKPLSFGQPKPVDDALPTPRTSRSHLLAGLRTAPRSATAAVFPSPSPPAAPMQGYGLMTADQVLGPPDIHVEAARESMDPALYAQLVTTNLYLAHQQRALQQQLRDLQTSAQRHGLNMYHHQQHPQVGRPVYAVYNPVTGQHEYFVDQASQAAHAAHYDALLADQLQQLQLQQAQLQAQAYAQAQVQVQAQAQAQAHAQAQAQAQAQAYVHAQALSQAPRVRVSPPPSDLRVSPSRASPAVTPLPPPSANAFRRHVKAVLSVDPKSPATAAPAHGPGQGRAGEHPTRQPRGPPSFDELVSKPTARHEGSKNFVARDLPGSGSCSPVSDAESERSGSGVLEGDADAEPSLPSSRTSTGSWGAIGSERPVSRQRARRSVDSVGSGNGLKGPEGGRPIEKRRSLVS